MSETAIRVTGLGKRYVIGTQRRRTNNLREQIQQSVAALIRRSNTDQIEQPFWALKDVSFDVSQGEVVGIIGRNGAGKSTLLKILSRITDLTEGQIEIFGRVGSLLEVGTGFHPELTGRENIHLNGAILGMKRTEIRSKFDEIVAFAETERFLDTPVKYYSSGMYMRLAFAVAAHLEPQVLVVDEVLAVGDAAFQKKCLGKMNEVARQGRTVLFVSHNMGAVQSLCSRAVVLMGGRVSLIAPVAEAVSHYMTLNSSASAESLWEAADGLGTDEVRLHRVAVLPDGGQPGDPLLSDRPILVEMEFENHCLDKNLCVGFELTTQDGSCVLWSYQTDVAEDQWPRLQTGFNRLTCSIPAGLLNGRSYSLAPKIGVHNRYWILNGDPLLSFDVELTHGRSPLWTSLSDGKRPGIISPILQWHQSPDERGV